MDLQKIIAELVSKLNLDTSLIEKFTKDPVATVKGLLTGDALNPSQLIEVVKGVAAKLNIDLSSFNLEELVGGDAKGILDKIKALFGK